MTNPGDQGSVDVFASATSMTRALRAKAISARELLDVHLDRVAATNGSINAIVALDEEGARKSAFAADEALARDEMVGPLHGLPMTVKDVFPVVGMPVTGGMPHLAGYMPPVDADVVTSLRAAGAIIFGKTNVPEGAGDHQSYNPMHGVTVNPWDVTRSPGGSSGGSAAALAAGMTPLEIGSDVGGSIRCPAHFCGVYGHKSSMGLVPLLGHVPPKPGTLRASEMSVAGPMSRDPYDLELALDVVAGPQRTLRGGPHWAIPAPRHNRLKDFRVAVWLEAEGHLVDRGYLDAIEGLVSDLQHAGAKVQRSVRPAIDPAFSAETYFRMLFGEFCAAAPEDIYQRSLSADIQRGGDNGPFGRWIASATGQSLRDWLELIERRQHLRKEWATFFDDIDVLLCPVMSTVAFPHDHRGADHVAQLGRTVEISGRQEPYLENLRWPGLITVAHLPSTVIPTLRLVGGLPAGVQVVGGHLNDKTTIRFAQVVHDALGSYVMPDARGRV